MIEEETLTAEADAERAEKEERAAKNRLDLLDGERAVLMKKKAEFKALRKSAKPDEKAKVKDALDELNEMITSFNQRVVAAKDDFARAKSNAEEARRRATEARKEYENAKLTAPVPEEIEGESVPPPPAKLGGSETFFSVPNVPDDLPSALVQLNNLRGKAEKLRQEYEQANKEVNDVLDQILRKFGPPS